MGATIVKKLVSLAVPEGLLLFAAVILVESDRLQSTAAGFLDFYPYAVLGAGLLLGWRFQRSRLLFAMVLLALTDRALVHFGPPLDAPDRLATGRVVFHATTLLLPLNLAALALLPERGTLTAAGLWRWATIVAQAGLVAFLAGSVPEASAAVLKLRLLPAKLFAWTPVAQPALAAFGAALALVAASWILAPSATGRAFLWATVASFLGLSADRGGPAPTLYFATAGLMLIVAVIEASYRMAYQDGLTGLPARRALNDALLRLGEQYTVAMVDVDHFKRINDSYGHDVGDQVLRMVAAKLATVSGGGRAFRYGGEEFALLFPGKGVEEILPELERLREAVEETRFTLRGRLRPRRKPEQPKDGGGGKRRRQVAITVSIGAAERNHRHAKPDQVIQAADRALYRAKDGGRNRVER